MAQARALRPRRTAALTGWRLALAYAVLLAFAFQTYVAQTHIHLTQAETAKLYTGGTGHDRHDKYPASDDPANCPICQEILHSGHFVTPSALAYAPPALAVSTIALVDTALPFILALSHSWRGRAPPQV